MIVGQAFDLGREAQICEDGNLGDDPPHDDGIALARVENVDAESGGRRAGNFHGVGTVQSALVFEGAELLGIVAGQFADHRGQLLIIGRGAIEEACLAVDADHRNAAGLEMQVRSIDLDGGLEEIPQRETAFLDVNRGLGHVALGIERGIFFNIVDARGHNFGLFGMDESG